MAKIAYADALATYRVGRRRFRKRVLEDIAARNLPAVKGAFSQFRDVVYNFDGEIRKIDFPDSVQPEVLAVLEANRTEVADLDAVGAAADFAEIQRLLSNRLQEDDNTLSRAIKDLTSAL